MSNPDPLAVMRVKLFGAYFPLYHLVGSHAVHFYNVHMIGLDGGGFLIKYINPRVTIRVLSQIYKAV